MLNVRSVQADLESEQIDFIFAAELQEAIGKTGPVQAAAGLQSDAAAAHIGWSGSLCALSIALLIVTLYASVVFHWGGPGVTLLLVSLPAGLWLAARTTPAALPPRQSRAERLYSGLILELSRPGGSRRFARLGPRQRLQVSEGRGLVDREPLLAQSKDLMRSFRRLEAQRNRLAVLLDSPHSGIELVVAEHADLVQRHRDETDPIARESLFFSAAYCAARIDNLRALQPLQARILAHQEMICQALALAHAALVRADIGHSLTLARGIPDTARLVSSAQELSRRTQSLEDAVAEIGALSSAMHPAPESGAT